MNKKVRKEAKKTDWKNAILHLVNALVVGFSAYLGTDHFKTEDADVMRGNLEHIVQWAMIQKTCDGTKP